MTVHIFGGGTFSHVRNHLALAAPAFGRAGRYIRSYYTDSHLHLTKMADIASNIETNEDVERVLDRVIGYDDTKIIYFSVALCDFDGFIHGEESGKYATRLKTSGSYPTMDMVPTEKLIGKIRKERKDIFVVGFKTTCGATSDEQYIAGLNLLKASSINLVLANDTLTRNNMIIVPEEARYGETKNRLGALSELVQMTNQRSRCTFTRSVVAPGNLYSFQTDSMIPDNLREVVNHCVTRGAYKPFRGATAGHFAVRIDENMCLTSRRKTNYNEPGGLDLVQVEYEGRNNVIAVGAKPSVGGQSQRIIFDEHPDADCIVHFHCPMKDISYPIPIADQAPYECGSHQCGENTSRHLREIDGIKVVMLDNHGPNIVFSKDVPASRVINFIETNFDLTQKTGGLVA